MTDIEPLNVSREDFPKSLASADGMKAIDPPCDYYEITYEYDVPYVVRDGGALYLQIIKPIAPSNRTPLIIFIPGSAFRQQNVKSRVPQLGLLAARGYTVALLEYRGSQLEPFPGFVLDAKAGIKFMKKHSREYNIDPEKVFLMGDSSGGYTALMAGLTCGVADLEDDELKGFDYSVKGVIDHYGPTDITTMNDEPSIQDHRVPGSPEGEMLGGINVLENLGLAQKTIVKNYISENRFAPPVLIFHGSNDELVPFGQSCRLYEALKSGNKTAELYRVEGAHHGDRRFWSKYVIDLTAEFIDKNC